MNTDEDNLIPPAKPSMFSLALKWAGIISLAIIGISIIIYLAGLSSNRAVGWVNYILMLVGVIFASRIFRDENCDGYISFGRAFSFGYLLMIIVGIITAVYTYLFFSFIAPELIDQIMAEVENNMLNSGQSEEQIELAMSYSKKFMTPAWMTIWMILGTMFFGAVIALISSLIVKRENPDFRIPQ